MKANPAVRRRRGVARHRRRGVARHRQRGVALIIALILVSLATLLATKLSFDGWLERRRTIGVLAAEQALQFGMGAEALAADVLAQPAGGGQQDTLAAPWAQPTQPLPITPENDPEGEPIGTLQGAIEDLQGRFNLNTLARVLPDGKSDPFPFEQFKRLLVSVKLEPKWAGLARDWITATDVPGTPDGAKDAVYTAQSPPYRTGEWPMMSASELMNLPGFDVDRYRKIAPFVTALPSAITKINICTASGVVLDSLADNLNNEYAGSAELLASSRKATCFPDPAAFKNILGKSAGAAEPYYGVQSVYFRLTTRVVLGTTEFTLYSLLYRTGGGKVTPMLRTFGTL